jgi:hypothetical protein
MAIINDADEMILCVSKRDDRQFNSLYRKYYLHPSILCPPRGMGQVQALGVGVLTTPLGTQPSFGRGPDLVMLYGAPTFLAHHGT